MITTPPHGFDDTWGAYTNPVPSEIRDSNDELPDDASPRRERSWSCGPRWPRRGELEHHPPEQQPPPAIRPGL